MKAYAPNSEIVPKLNVPSLSVPRLRVPTLQVPVLNVPGKTTAKPIERRHVIGLGDIILGDPISGTRQLQETLEDNDLDFLVAVPLLNRFVGAGLSIKERTLDPLLQGDFGKIGINFLESAADTADTLANPVKSLMPWAGGGTSDDFLKSMGWLEGSYREQYRWDTGNWVVDFLGEMISDPVNWVTLGAGILESGGTKALTEATEQTLKQSTKLVLKDSDEVLFRNIGKKIAENTIDSDKQIISMLIDRLEDNKKYLLENLRNLKPGTVDYEEALKAIKANQELLMPGAEGKLAKLIADIRLTDGYNYYASIMAAKNFADETNRALNLATKVLNPLWGGGSLAIKKYITPYFKTLWNKFVSEKQMYDLDKDFGRRPKAFRKQVESVLDTNKRLNQRYFKTLDEALEGYDYDTNKLQKLYLSIYLNKRLGNYNPELTERIFTQRLTRMFPKLFDVDGNIVERVVSETGFNKTRLIKTGAQLKKFANEFVNTPKVNIRDIAGAMTDAAEVVKAGQDLYIEEAKAQALEILNKNFDTTVTKNIKELLEEEDYGAPRIIAFLQSNLLNIDGKQYSLSNLKELFDELSESNPEKFMEIKGLLDFFGITLENAEKVDKLYNRMKTLLETKGNKATPQVKKITNKLKDILEKGVTGAYTVDSEADSFIDNISKLVRTNREDLELKTKFIQAADADTKTIEKTFTDVLNTNVETIEDAKTLVSDFKKYLDSLQPVLFNEVRPKVFERINQIPFEDYLMLLDDFDVYYGTDIMNSSYIRNILDFDFDSDNVDLRSFLNHLEELQAKTKHWASVVRENETALAEVSEKKPFIRFIQDLNSMFNDPKTLTLVDNLADMLDTQKAIYSLRSSQFNNYVISNLNLMSMLESMSDEKQKLFKEVIKPNSLTRKRLEHIAQVLSQNQDTIQASDELRRILGSLDVITKYNSILNTDYFPNLDGLPDTYRKYVRTEIDNIIRKHGYKDITQVSGLEEQFTDKFIRQFDRDNRETFTNWLLENQVTQDNSVTEQLDELQKLIESGEATDADYDLYDELIGIEPVSKPMEMYEAQEMYNNLLDQLRFEVQNTFKEYTQTLAEIAIRSNMPGIKFAPEFFTSSIVSNMTSLGLDAESVLKALAQEDTKYRTLAYNFIELNANNEIKDATDLINKYLYDAHNAALKTVENATEDMAQQDFTTKLITALSDKNSGLNRAITQGFSDIGQVNAAWTAAEGTNKVLTASGRRKLYNINRYITQDTLNRVIRENTIYDNIYAASTGLGWLGAKKEFDPLFISNHMIAPKNIGLDANKDANLYLTLYTLFNDAYQMIDRTSVINEERVRFMRNALTQFYSRNNNVVNIPFLYFDNISDKDVLVWDTITRNRSLFSVGEIAEYGKIKQQLFEMQKESTKARIKIEPNRIRNIKFSINEMADYYSDISNLYNDMDYILKQPDLAPGEAWKEIVENAPINNIKDVRQYVGRDLLKNMKSLDSLDGNQQRITDFIRQDAVAFDKTRALSRIEDDTRLVNEVITDKETLSKLKMHGVANNATLNSKAVGNFETNERALGLYNSINEMNAKQLRSWVDDNTKGVLFVIEPGIRNPGEVGTWLNKFTKAELKEAGLHIAQLPHIAHGYMIQSLGTKLPHTKYYYNIPKFVFEDHQKVVTNIYKKNRFYFNFGKTTVPYELFTGDLINADDWNAFLSNKNIRKLFVTEQNALQNASDSIVNNFLKKSELQPNFMVIGDANALNKLFTLEDAGFKALNRDAPVRANDIISRTMYSNIATIKSYNNIKKYLQLWYNKDFSIGSKMFRPVLENATDEELKNFFKRNNFVACVLKQDKAGLPKVYKIYVDNQAMLQNAIAQNAIVVPQEIYRNMVLTVNKREMQSALWKFYTRFIVQTYKSIYLTTPGFLMRNALDSEVYKNASTNGGLVGIWDNFKYEHKAMQMWKWYSDIQADIIESGNNQTLNRKLVKQKLKKMKKEEQQLYRIMDIFTNSAASGGYTEAMERMLLSYNEKNYSGGVDLWNKVYTNNILQGKLSPIKWTQDINNTIEQTARLGLFLKYIDESGDYAKAIREVVNTHFDYEIRNEGMAALEQVFWFSTFPINNMLYYLNEGLERHPEMFKAQLDALDVSWNRNGLTWEDVRNNKYYTYNALLGNLRIKWSRDGKTILLKTGSSVLDFFNILFNPAGEALDRLNPFLAVILGQEDFTDLNPFNATWSRFNQIQQGKSYVPSVYTILEEYKKRKYPKRTYTRYPGKGRTWLKYPKRLRKPRPLVRAPRATTYRYYWNQGKNAHIPYFRTTSMEPYWYTRDYRYKRISRKYGKNRVHHH